MCPMRFRTGLLTGLGVGYVLGARAGRERYEQLMAAFERISSDERLSSVADLAARVTETPRTRALELVGSGLRSAGSAIRERSSSG